eukprot:GHVT01085048.1.p1 GENE.GHVT01085048.1~~GHVT01085048.1.p1  ORF type:complete len:223 (-),score=36.63 GHVT01085048.1:741-1409(-)
MSNRDISLFSSGSTHQAKHFYCRHQGGALGLPLLPPPHERSRAFLNFCWLQSRKKSAETFVAATPLVTETRTANTDAEASISVNAQESPNPPFEVNNYYGHPLAKPCSRPVEAFPQDLGTLGGVAAPGGGRATPSQGKPLKRLLPILVAAILVPTAIFGLLRLTPTSRPSKKGTGKPTTNKAVPLSAMSDSKQIDVIPLSGRNANVESRFDRCSSNLRKYNQ